MSAKIEALRHQLETLSAVEVAELFLSPHISSRILLEATLEPGPSMWIVNRSDVSTGTLEKLLRHKITSIAERAAEKIKSRKATITHLSEPIVDSDLSQIQEYEVEDILGHPLCPWEAMLFFAIHTQEDVRASACLSLTRRLWEHPAQSADFPLIESQFKDIFSILAGEDISPMVRAYAARIPMWTADEVKNFINTEAHSHVRAKWLQHDECPIEALDSARILADAPDPYLRRVFALDERINSALRKKLLQESQDSIETLLHEAYLE